MLPLLIRLIFLIGVISLGYIYEAGSYFRIGALVVATLAVIGGFCDASQGAVFRGRKEYFVAPAAIGTFVLTGLVWSQDGFKWAAGALFIGFVGMNVGMTLFQLTYRILSRRQFGE